MAGLYDDAGVIIDPTTGAVISAPTTNTGAPGSALGTVSALGSALRQNLLPPGPTPQVQPQQPPQPPQPAPQGTPAAPAPAPQVPPQAAAAGVAPPSDAMAQLAAIGIPTQALGQDMMGSAMGLPPGSASVASGTPTPPFSAPGANPPPPPQAQPQAQPQQPQDPWSGVSNNARNNPLNLKYAGQDGATNVNGFAAFPTMDAGIAAAKNQFALDAGKGINTLTGLVSSWAPPNENDTAAYISTVAGATGINPNAKIDLTDPTVQAKLIPAMSLMENGPAGGAGKPSTAPQGQPPAQMTLASQNSQTGPQGSFSPSVLNSQPNYTIPYPDAAKPNKSGSLLALASGLLAGPNLSLGLSKGLQGFLGEQQQDRTAQMESNNQDIQLQNLGISNAYKNAMLGNAVNRTNLMGNKANGPPMVTTDAQGNQKVVQRLSDGSEIDLPGVPPSVINAGTAQQRLQMGQQALSAKLNPDVQARLKQAGKAATDAETDINNVISSQPQDEQGLADINNAQTLIAQKPELMGPTLANRWSRFAAQNGLSGDAADLNALQKMTADQRNTALSSLTGGHVGGIRSNAELNNLSQAVANVNTSPAAANFILNMQKTQLQARQAWRQELTDRYQTDPDSITGRQYNVTKQQFLDKYYKDNPLPDYKSPSAQPQAALPQPGSGNAPVKGVSNGVQWSFTPSSPQ